MKVKLFSHLDLDGCGCAVVGKIAFKGIDVEYCSNSEINDKVAEFINSGEYEKYDRVFITDISVNEEVAELIENTGDLKWKTNLIDHHATAKWLSDKYAWAYVCLQEENLYPEKEPGRPFVPASGTTLFYKFLLDKNIPEITYSENLKEFVETVRRYDTWDWANVYNDELPVRLNTLFNILGIDAFVERFSQNPSVKFTSIEEALLAAEEKRKNDYISLKMNSVKTMPAKVGDKEYKIAYVSAENYISELGNKIAKKYEGEVDFVVILAPPNKVSLRGVKDDIHLGQDVAKFFGGGGHPRAAGFSINDYVEDTVYRIFGGN